jgi:hypothetical protein
MASRRLRADFFYVNGKRQRRARELFRGGKRILGVGRRFAKMKCDFLGEVKTC